MPAVFSLLPFFSCSLFSRFAWISFVFIYCFSSLWTYDAPDAHREFIGRDNGRDTTRWCCWCWCWLWLDWTLSLVSLWALRMHVYKAIALSQWIDETPRETQNKLNKTCKFWCRAAWCDRGNIVVCRCRWCLVANDSAKNGPRIKLSHRIAAFGSVNMRRTMRS